MLATEVLLYHFMNRRSILAQMLGENVFEGFSIFNSGRHFMQQTGTFKEQCTILITNYVVRGLGLNNENFWRWHQLLFKCYCAWFFSLILIILRQLGNKLLTFISILLDKCFLDFKTVLTSNCGLKRSPKNLTPDRIWTSILHVSSWTFHHCTMDPPRG